MREIIASKERDKGMLSWVGGGGGFGTPPDPLGQHESLMVSVDWMGYVMNMYVCTVKSGYKSARAASNM